MQRQPAKLQQPQARLKKAWILGLYILQCQLRPDLVQDAQVSSFFGLNSRPNISAFSYRLTSNKCNDSCRLKVLLR